MLEALGAWPRKLRNAGALRALHVPAGRSEHGHQCTVHFWSKVLKCWGIRAYTLGIVAVVSGIPNSSVLGRLGVWLALDFEPLGAEVLIHRIPLQSS